MILGPEVGARMDRKITQKSVLGLAPRTQEAAQRSLGSHFGAVWGPFWSDFGTNVGAIWEPSSEHILKPTPLLL